MVLMLIKDFFKLIIPYLWKFKWVFVFIGMLFVISFYKSSLEDEKIKHNTTITNQELFVEKLKNDSLELINEERRKSNERYHALVLETNAIQKRYVDREQSINSAVSTLTDNNNRLSQAIKAYTSTSGNTQSNHTDAERLLTIGRLYETCQSEQDYFATEASRLGNSTITLRDWGLSVEKAVNENE